jgi:Domain of unknown function (DUF6894)
MSRFYFHIHRGEQIIADQEGTDLVDIIAARNEALTAARQILAETIRSGHGDVPEALIIADSEGRELETVRFAALVPDRLKH